MRKLPYVVVYVDRGLTDDGFVHYLNMQWKEGWEYVSHLDGPERRYGSKQAVLMKKRDYPEMAKVMDAMMSLWGDKNMTTDELFANLTSILADDPTELSHVRAVLAALDAKDATEVRDRFEEWLRGLKGRPTIAFSSGRTVEISDELLEILEKESGK